MILGIRPTVDFAFKLMLGSPEHSAVTVHFLNAVLEGGPRIARAAILNPILGKDADRDKLAILDVRAEDEQGRQFNIEMQTSSPAGLERRLVYYASRLYVDQLDEGDGYNVLRPAINICVLERPFLADNVRLHLDFRLRGVDGRTLTDDLQIHLVELSKSRATAHNIEQVSRLERWAFFMRNADRLEPNTIRRLLPDPEFMEALGVLDMIARTPEQQMLYDARLKQQRDEAARLDSAENKGREDGRREGRMEGRIEGRIEGEQAGQVRGEQIGQIRSFEEFLGLPPSPPEELAKMNVDELVAKAADLKRRLRAREA